MVLCCPINRLLLPRIPLGLRTSSSSFKPSFFCVRPFLSSSSSSLPSSPYFLPSDNSLSSFSRASFSTTSSSADSSVSAPDYLSDQIRFSDVVRPKWLLEEENLLRQPLWRQWWEAQFASRTLLLLGSSWASFVTVAAILWWSRVFDPPPPERYDLYWYNSPKFRILTARENPGSRPAHTISTLTYSTRYFHRGLDHPFGLNEVKDLLFKLREKYIIEKHPGVQYPYVFRQFNKVKTPAVLNVNLYALPQKSLKLPGGGDGENEEH